MKAQGEDFTVVRLKQEQDGGNFCAVFAGGELVEGRGSIFGDFEGALIFAGFAHLIEGGHLALAREIDDEVAGDGEEPGIEAGFAVVLRAAKQDTHPGFLEEIFCGFAFAGEEEEIAQEAMLVGLDELIEEGGIVAFEAAGDGLIFLLGGLLAQGGFIACD